MAETKTEIIVPGPSGIAMTAEKEPKGIDIYSAEMLKELEKRNKAVKTALSGIKKNIEKAVFNLYWIYQTGMYKTMGFDSITDYAAAEFDFSKSTTYGFISLAERFGKRDKDGKIQESIDDKYKEYSSSKLTAMTKLEDEEIESSGITPEMSVRDIKKAVKRTLGSTGSQSKTKNKPEPEDGEQPENEKFTFIIDEVLDGKVLKSRRWDNINEKYILDMLKFHKDYQLVFHSLREGKN